MKTLYLDIFSGISGDMFLGAMLDLGVELRRLEAELGNLKVTGYHLHVSRQKRANIEGIKFDVHLDHEHGAQGAHQAQDDHKDLIHKRDHAHDHPHDHHHETTAVSLHSSGHQLARTHEEIARLIDRSALSVWVKTKATALFQRIAVAEGKIHGHPPEQVHFHEVGAIDSIVDIVGGCVALELLGCPRVLASTVVEGTGWVDCAHGRFPVPTTATLEILGARGIPLTQCDEPHELVTPTGAAILAEFVESFGPMRELVAVKIGYGLGARENRSRPNVLRAILSDGASPAQDWEIDTITALETNLDDFNPEIVAHVTELAFAQGALDVFQTPIQMKKNRSGILLSLLCPASEADKLAELILRETSSFGVRRHVVERRKLHRHFQTVITPYGSATVKVGTLNGRVLQVTPEFESCKQLAEQAKVPLKVIYEAAQQQARHLTQS